MADALGHPELALDARFLSNDLRCRPAMVSAIEEITRTAPIGHWIDRLNDAGVPCAPISPLPTHLQSTTHGKAKVLFF